MENSIAMTRMPSVAPPGVEHPPRPPAAVPSTSASRNPSARPMTAVPATRPQPPAGPPSAERVDVDALLERVGEQVSEFPRPSGRLLDSQLQTDPSRVVILVESTDTGGVVRSIPPEVVQYLPAARDADRQALANLKA